MHRAIRTQADGKGDLWSRATRIDCSGDRDVARQEFKDEADINKLLSRYGVGPMPQRQTTYMEVDYSLDLQTALTAVDAAAAAHRDLPQTLRDRYPNWPSLLNALDRGELRIDLSNRGTPPSQPPESEPPPPPTA